MIRRLVEGDYYSHRGEPSRGQIAFWLREARTASILLQLCQEHPRAAGGIAKQRQAVGWARKNDLPKVEDALRREQEEIRAQDKEYWKPLRAELARWWREQRAKQSLSEA